MYRLVRKRTVSAATRRTNTIRLEKHVLVQEYLAIAVSCLREQTCWSVSRNLKCREINQVARFSSSQFTRKQAMLLWILEQRISDQQITWSCCHTRPFSCNWIFFLVNGTSVKRRIDFFSLWSRECRMKTSLRSAVVNGKN